MTLVEPVADVAGALEEAGRATASPSGLSIATLPVAAVDPVGLYVAATHAGYEAAFWSRPDQGQALVGVGRAWAAEAEGPDRIARVDRAWRAIATDLAGVRTNGAGARTNGAGPLILGGLGFDGDPTADAIWGPFPRASLVLPSITLSMVGEAATLTVALSDGDPPTRVARRWASLAEESARIDAPDGPGEPAILSIAGEQPDRERWQRVVALFAGAVGRGRLDKVVLARRVDLVTARALDVGAALRSLVEAEPTSAVFAFDRGGRTFLGATPERLVQTRGSALSTAAIAGSTGRGADAAEDRSLAEALLASDKEREEHEVVVAALRRRLAPLARSLSIASQPGILRMRHVQHLVTEVEGVLREPSGLLALAQVLHPTPAVGGEPTDLALGLISEHEDFDRGWYTGPVGWVGSDGDGELMVALRGAVIEGARASLFAGCGIVADSDPDLEWEESRMKLRTMVEALGRAEDGL
jgi:isochorismate synthase